MKALWNLYPIMLDKFRARLARGPISHGALGYDLVYLRLYLPLAIGVVFMKVNP
jgi:hypothetical protein